MIYAAGNKVNRDSILSIMMNEVVKVNLRNNGNRTFGILRCDTAIE